MKAHELIDTLQALSAEEQQLEVAVTDGGLSFMVTGAQVKLDLNRVVLSDAVEDWRRDHAEGDARHEARPEKRGVQIVWRQWLERSLTENTDEVRAMSDDQLKQYLVTRWGQMESAANRRE